MENEAIIRAALGRLNIVGDLYNARTDQFCGISLLKSNAPVDTLDDPFSDFELIFEDSFHHKLHYLDVTAELKASFLAGLVTLEGSGKFLQDEKSSARSVRNTLKYNITTKTQKLNIFDDDVKPIVNVGLLEDSEPTHVLTQIKWGANFNVVIEYANEESENQREIGGILQAYISKLATSVKGEANVKFNEKENTKSRKFSFKIYGDVVSHDTAPQTIEDATALLAKMPECVKEFNDGKGRPITFTFTPLSKVRPHFQLTKQITSFICKLEEEAVLQFVQLFDETLRVKQNLNDFFTDVQKYREYLPSDSITTVRDLKASFESEEAKLKSRFAALLVDVRSGVVKVDKLYELVSEYKTTKYSPANVQSDLDTKFINEIEKTNLVRIFEANGVQVCAKGQTLDVFVCRPSTRWFVLYYKKPSDEVEKELWMQNRHLFLSTIKQQRLRIKQQNGEASDGVARTTNILTSNNPELPLTKNFQLASSQDQYTITLIGKTLTNSKRFRLLLKDTASDTSDAAELLSYTNDIENSCTSLTSKGAGSSCSSLLKEESHDLQVKKDTFFWLEVMGDGQGFKVVLKDGGELAYRNRLALNASNISLTIDGDISLFLVRVDKIVSDSSSSSSSAAAIQDSDFVFVDTDILPSLAVPQGITIYQYNDGLPVSRDMYKDSLKYVDKRLAKCTAPVTLCQKPNKRAYVKLPCPGSLGELRQCSPENTSWLCWRCCDQLEYGFDECFYCSCGKGEASRYIYKCENTTTHGQCFIALSKGDLEFQLNKLRPFEELNILLLGCTGVGKSTWINGFANYLTYDTIDEAQEKGMACEIPISFSEYDDDTLEETICTVGKGSNEIHEDGQSSTQYPNSHAFIHQDKVIRIIDTPGIGDTRGREQDKINFESIINHLSFLEEIHGIVILMKPDETRMHALLEFCVKELLVHLHKDAITNICFCFTHARITSYKAGASLSTLRKLFSSSNIQIQLAKDTVYCVDNEAVRFLAAYQNGVHFDKEMYVESWEKSVKETKRLLQHIRGLPPHEVKHTLSLNATRQTLLKLATPLPKILQNIELNVSILNDHVPLLMSAESRMEVLQDRLYVPGIQLERIDLDYPKTVCADPKCTESVEVYTNASGQSTSTTNYKQVCHDGCGISGVTVNQINVAQLQGCYCMGPGFICRFCGHSWEVHMHITYDTKQSFIQVKQANIQEDINREQTAMEKMRSTIRSCKARKEQLEKEQRIITAAAAKFATFLKKNSITMYNDAIAKYMDHLISIEERKKEMTGSRYNQDTLNGLKANKLIYEEQIRILQQSMAACGEGDDNKKAESIEEINRTLEELFDLEISGKDIRDSLAAANYADRMIYNERPYDPVRAYHKNDKKNKKEKSNAGVIQRIGRFFNWS